jgi:hypothetical protein
MRAKNFSIKYGSTAIKLVLQIRAADGQFHLVLGFKRLYLRDKRFDIPFHCIIPSPARE